MAISSQIKAKWESENQLAHAFNVNKLKNSYQNGVGYTKTFYFLPD